MMYDVVIVGAGQAGLAAGYYLRDAKRHILILDQHARIGDSWRQRYDSLQLFTPRRFSALPGLSLEGDQDGFPSKDEIADYLETYAHKFQLPVTLRTPVKKISYEDGLFTLHTTTAKLQAKQVIIAVGALQKPFIPPIAHKLPKTITQLHSSTYQNSSQISQPNVLVVGAGNSGTQIAAELAKEKKVFLAMGHKIYSIPQRIGPKSLFSLTHSLGLLDFIMLRPTHTRLGEIIYNNQNKIVFGAGLNRAIRAGTITIKGRLLDYKDGAFVFQDQTSVRAETVIWATGFKPDFSWIAIPQAFNAGQTPIHTRGVSNIPGLYFLGLPALHTLGSSHLGWIKYDAAYISNFLIAC